MKAFRDVCLQFGDQLKDDFLGNPCDYYRFCGHLLVYDHTKNVAQVLNQASNQIWLESWFYIQDKLK